MTVGGGYGFLTGKYGLVIDNLVQAISRQTAVLWDASRSAVSVLQDTLQERNEHAKARARQIREVGGQWFSSLKEHFKGRAEMARENARAMKERRVLRAVRRRERRAERRDRRKLARVEPL